ncbi:Protein ANTAGONIST OF LIKE HETEROCHROMATIN PROTEIN 1 [Bienertia sinuspersici]
MARLGVSLRRRKEFKFLQFIILMINIIIMVYLIKHHLRMNREAFSKLCEMVSEISGLCGTRHMSVEEIVAIFLYTLAHHKKNRIVGAYFYRSGESISCQFHLCLKANLKLHFKSSNQTRPFLHKLVEDITKPKVVYSQNLRMDEGSSSGEGVGISDSGLLKKIKLYKCFA